MIRNGARYAGKSKKEIHIFDAAQPVDIACGTDSALFGRAEHDGFVDAGNWCLHLCCCQYTAVPYHPENGDGSEGNG